MYIYVCVYVCVSMCICVCIIEGYMDIEIPYFQFNNMNSEIHKL